MQNENEGFKALLKSKGLKVTNQRIAVLEVLQSGTDRHLTAEEIFDLVREKHPDIGLATVYRTIQLLVDMKLIEKLSLDDGFIRYEIDKDTDTGHRHHHLVCLGCGKVICFQKDLVTSLETEIAKSLDFYVKDHELKVYGYCKNCEENVPLEKNREEIHTKTEED